MRSFLQQAVRISHVLIIIALALLAQLIGAKAQRCRFPKEWRGKWFQSRIGDVTIGKDDITGKGQCVNQRGDLYIIDNNDIGCRLCMKIIAKHRNVIQYQEKPSSSVACPFQDAYHFTYNNNTGGFCNSPVSYLRGCASDAKFRFHFKHCPMAAYTYEQDLDFQCLAVWKDKAHFIYGRFNGPDLNHRDSQYRCFMYHKLGTIFHVSMSSDASCRGLRSARSGPLVMEFTKDVFGWPAPTCIFPPWLTSQTWRDLSGRNVYDADDDSVLRMSVTQRSGIRPEPYKAFRCFNVRQENLTNSQFVAVSFTSSDCAVQYQCIRLLRRFDHVLEVHHGRLKDYHSGPCWDEEFANATKHLLIPSTATSTDCPFRGRYMLPEQSHSCMTELRSGCAKPNIIDTVTTCRGGHKDEHRLECIFKWDDGKKSYAIARRAGDQSSLANCFNFRRRGKHFFFATDRKYNIGVPHIFTSPLKYKTRSERENCIIEKMVDKLPAIQSDQSEAHMLDDASQIEAAHAQDGGAKTRAQGDTYRHVVDAPVEGHNGAEGQGRSGGKRTRDAETSGFIPSSGVSFRATALACVLIIVMR